MSDPKPPPLSGKLAFLGAGRMATALAEGFVAAGVVEAGQLTASAPSEASRDAFASKVVGATVTADNAVAMRGASVVVLAVKPQVLPAVLEACRDAVPADALIVSIAAGVPLAALADLLPAGARVVRVMPNTPCLIGRGATGYSPGPHATDVDAALVDRLMNAVGYAVRVDEKLIDAVIGVAGSATAFVYTVIESLADAGVRAGLPRAVALELAARTAAGAGEMVTATGQHPAELRDAVTSPGGTTAAGLAQLEKHSLPWALHAAVDATIQRSKEIADG